MRASLSPFSGHPHRIKGWFTFHQFWRCFLPLWTPRGISCLVRTWTPSVIGRFLGSYADLGNATVSLQVTTVFEGLFILHSMRNNTCNLLIREICPAFPHFHCDGARWLIFGCIHILFSNPPSCSSNCLGGSQGTDGPNPNASSLSRSATAWLASISA